jgi:hypothetical protein
MYVGMELIISKNSSVKKCTNEAQAKDSYKKFYGLYNLESEMISQCSHACEKISYNLKMNDFHSNSYMGQGNYANSTSQIGKGVIVLLSFLTNLVEERNETLIYDFPNFLSAGMYLYMYT